MNKLFLTGRITKNIDLRYTQNQTPVARFTIAVNRDFKNKQGQYESDFINCIAYRQTADVLSKYVEKGDLIGIEGSIRTGSYETDGKKTYITDIQVDRVEFLQSKPKEVETHKEEVDPFKSFGEQIEVEDSNLPF